jgi:pimeloyl-ACP methyl ester carboxylesterase
MPSCLESMAGNRSTTIQGSDTSTSRARLQRPSFADVNGRTSSTSGTISADKTRSLSEADRRAYTAAYARPGRMRAAWAYFVSFQRAANDFARLARTKLTMPVLSVGGEKANGAVLAHQIPLVATDAKSVVLRTPVTG